MTLLPQRSHAPSPLARVPSVKTMGITRRNTKAQRSDSKGRLRHPLLKIGSIHLLLYNYIKNNPGVKFRDTKHITDHPQALSDLVHEGLVHAYGKIPRSYQAVPENETGKRRDRVKIKLAIYANEYGEFSVRAELEGQKLTATEDNPQQVVYREYVIPIPFPDDPYATRPIVDVNDRIDGSADRVYTPDATDDLTIEAEWTNITPD